MTDQLLLARTRINCLRLRRCGLLYACILSYIFRPLPASIRISPLTSFPSSPIRPLPNYNNGVSSLCSPSLPLRSLWLCDLFSFFWSPLYRLEQCHTPRRIRHKVPIRPTGCHRSNGRVLQLLGILHSRFSAMYGIMVLLVGQAAPSSSDFHIINIHLAFYCALHPLHLCMWRILTNNASRRRQS